MTDKPYNVYTESGPGAPVVTLAAGERILSIAVEPDGVNVVTIDIATINLNRSDTIRTKNGAGTDWDGALRGPGTVTFGNLGLGHYIVTTEQQ